MYASLYRINVGNFVNSSLNNHDMLAALAQIVTCLPLVQQVRGSIPGGVVNFNLKIFNLRARGVEMHTF